jgi:hypothetical protein
MRGYVALDIWLADGDNYKALVQGGCGMVVRRGGDFILYATSPGALRELSGHLLDAAGRLEAQQRELAS